MIQEAADADYQVWLKVGQKISRATRELLKESGTSDVFKRVQSEEVDLIRSLPLEAAIKVQEWTKEGLATGERFEAITKRILDELPPITRTRAICIARTETARARSNFTQARARNVGSPGYIWHTVGDSRVRPMHAALDGTYQTWDNPPVCDVGRGGQPLHAHAGCIFNCFPGETVVRIPDDLVRVIRAPYDGRVIEIDASGTVVTATPNHPMLTQRGWIAAGEINEGDYLLQPLCDAVGMIEPDANNRVARIGELFDSLSGKAVRTPGVHFDFYGDLPNGDVDTAIVEGGLSDDVVSNLRKSVGDLDLSGASGVMIGSLHDVANVGVSSRFGEGSSLFKGELGHSDVSGLGTSANRNVVFFKALLDGVSTYAKRFGDSKDAFSGLITADDLSRVKFESVVGDMPELPFKGVHSEFSEMNRKSVGSKSDDRSRFFKGVAALYKGFRVSKLSVRNFSGHVYTLETKKGWYGVTTLNFTAKNCRCWSEPVWPEELQK